jgi:hypothetical protein
MSCCNAEPEASVDSFPMETKEIRESIGAHKTSDRCILSFPPVEGIIDENYLAQFGDAKKVEMTISHLRKTFQQQPAPKPEDFGRIATKTIFSQIEVSVGWAACNPHNQ